jgi:hypothetical protein
MVCKRRQTQTKIDRSGFCKTKENKNYHNVQNFTPEDNVQSLCVKKKKGK